MRQVLENIESTKRRYALRGLARPLGWARKFQLREGPKETVSYFRRLLQHAAK